MSNLFAAHHVHQQSLPLFSAYYYRLWNNFEMTYHQHHSIEIMYVINGQCRIELLQSESPLLFSLKKGEFILLDGNVPHRLIVDAEGGCRMLNVEFTFHNGEPILPTLVELAEKNEELAYFMNHISEYVVLRDVDEVYATLKSLVLELDQQREQRANQDHSTWLKQDAVSLKLELLFTTLILHVAKLFQEIKLSQHRSTAAQYYVKQVQNYIQQHYDGDISVEQLARYVSVHPNYLHRIFRAEIGMTIIQYVNQFRLDKAKMLLSETDIAIADICEFVGINSRQYFHELFKKYAGVTPVQYREGSNRQFYDPLAKNK